MKKPVQVAALGLLLGTLACTCGPLSTITGVVGDAQEIGPTLEAAATLAGELEQFEELPSNEELLEEALPDESVPAPSSAGLVGTCATVTEAEVTSAFSLTATAQPPTEVNAQATCTFLFEDNSAYVLTVQDNNTPDVAAQNFSVLATAFVPNEPVTAPGFDQAVYAEDSFSLFAQSRQYLLTAAGSSTSVQEAVVEVTSLYAQRLP